MLSSLVLQARTDNAGTSAVIVGLHESHALEFNHLGCRNDSIWDDLRVGSYSFKK